MSGQELNRLFGFLLILPVVVYAVLYGLAYFYGGGPGDKRAG